MEYKRWAVVLILIFTMLFAWGCSPQREGYSLEELEATAEISILQTALAQPTETLPVLPTRPPTTTAKPNPTITLTPSLTTTLIPTNTETIAPSPTALAQVYVSGDTNCRTGPSNHYDWKTIVSSGQTVTVIGESVDNYYWVIENPNGPGTCWLWKAFTTLIAPAGRVPIFASPPTKTPTRTPTATPVPLARFQFSQVTSCNGQDVLVIKVFNTTSRTLQNWRARLFNLPGKDLQITIEEEQFSHDTNTCILTINNLAYRQTAYMIIPFDSSAAQDFFVEVEACNYDGVERDCAYDAISFNVAYITATPTYTPTPTNTPTPTSTPTRTPTRTP